MGSAKVTLREIDLSTRVPSFPGVYGGIVIASTVGQNCRGKVNEAVLVTSDTDFLKKYTLNEKIEVGMDNSYFSALAFLEKSNTLWIVRAANAALHGGLEIVLNSSSQSNAVIGAGLGTPEDDHTFNSSNEQAFLVAGTNPGTWNNSIGIQLYTYKADESIALANVSISDEIITVTQDWSTGRAVRLSTTGTVPGGLVAGTTYYVIRVSATTIKLATTLSNAQVGTAINLTDTGTGAHTMISIYVTKETGSFDILVYKGTTLVETWTCSRTTTAKDGNGQNIYLETILEGSDYIQAFDNLLASSSAILKDQIETLSLAAGSDGGTVTDAHMIIALAALENEEDKNVTVFMDGDWSTTAYQTELISVAESRKDCVAILSTPYSAEANSDYINELLDYRRITLNANTSYAALFTPSPKIFDKFNDRSIYVGADGYAAAAISETAANYEMWYPPAGFRRGIINVLDLRRRFSSGEMDVLYDNGLNPLRFAPGRGILIWGQKTLSSRPSSLDRLNVRLLLIIIEPAIKVALEDFVFEINDIATRALITSMIENYMTNIKSRRGVYDFRVVCDATNNTANDIDNKKLNVDLYVQPIQAAEFIRLTTVITRTGVDFSVAAQSI